jgi:hypothetical protein
VADAPHAQPLPRAADARGAAVEFQHVGFRHDARACAGCRDVAWNEDLAVPAVPDTREQVADPRTTYQMVLMLEGVVRRGTAAVFGREFPIGSQRIHSQHTNTHRPNSKREGQFTANGLYT